MGGSFPGIVAAFLILSAVVLYLMRNVLERAGVEGWSWLPEESQFKTYERQTRVVESSNRYRGHRRDGVHGPLPLAEVRAASLWSVKLERSVHSTQVCKWRPPCPCYVVL